jgi:hypothetical protein
LALRDNDLNIQLRTLTKNISSLNNLILETNVGLTSLSKNLKPGRKLSRADIAREYKTKGRRAFSPSGNIDPMEHAAINIDKSSEKLAAAFDNLSDVSSELNESSKRLATSVSGLARVGYAFRSFTPVAKNLVKMTPRMAGAVGKGAWGTVRAGARLGTLPARALARPVLKVSGAAGRASQELLAGEMGQPQTAWEAFKKLGSIGVAGMTGGLVPGTIASGVSQGAFNRMFPGGKNRPRKSYSETMKESAETISVGTRDAVEQMRDWWKDLPRKGKEGALEFAPEKEFQTSLDSIPEKLKETNEILTGEGKKPLQMTISKESKYGIFGTEDQEQRWVDKLKEAMKEAYSDAGKQFTLGLNSVFGLKTAFSYIVPVFGAGYRSELPSSSYVKQHGTMGAILKTLGLIYLHGRYASKENNDLLLQVTRVLMTGLGVEGSIRVPTPRTISEWVGIGLRRFIMKKGKELLIKQTGHGPILEEQMQKLNEFLDVTYGIKEFKTGESPVLKQTVLLEDIKESLSALVKKFRAEITRAPGFQGGTVGIRKTGPAILHEGESVVPKGGFFGRALKSIFGFKWLKSIPGIFKGMFGMGREAMGGGINWLQQMLGAGKEKAKQTGQGTIKSTLETIFENLWSPIKTKLDDLLDTLKAIWSEEKTTYDFDIKGIQQDYLNASKLKGMGAGAYRRRRNPIERAFTTMSTFAQKLSDDIAEKFRAEVSPEDPKTIANRIVATWKALPEDIQTLLSGKATTFASGVRQGLGAGASSTAAIEQAGSGVLNFFTEFFSPVTTAVRGAKGGLTAKIMAAASSTRDLGKSARRGGKAASPKLRRSGQMFMATVEDFFSYQNKMATAALTSAEVEDQLFRTLTGKLAPGGVGEITEAALNMKIQGQYVVSELLGNSLSRIMAVAGGWKGHKGRGLEKEDFTGIKKMFTESKTGGKGTIRSAASAAVGVIKEYFSPLKLVKESAIEEVKLINKEIKQIKEEGFIPSAKTYYSEFQQNTEDLFNEVKSGVAKWFEYQSGQKVGAQEGAYVKGINNKVGTAIRVGEGKNDEVVIPLDKSKPKIISWFIEAYNKVMGRGKTKALTEGGHFLPITERLDIIIELLQKGESKKRKGGGGGPGILKKLHDSWSKAKEGISGFFDKIGDKLKKAWETITKPFTTLGEKIDNLGNRIEAGARDIAQSVRASISDKWQRGKEKVGGLWSSAREGIGKAWGNIRGKASSAWGAITSPFKRAKEAMMSPFNWIGDKWKGFKEGVKQRVGGFVKKLMGKDVIGVDAEGKPAYGPVGFGKIYKVLQDQLKVQKQILKRVGGGTDLLGGGIGGMFSSLMPALGAFGSALLAALPLLAAGAAAIAAALGVSSWLRGKGEEKLQTAYKTAGAGVPTDLINKINQAKKEGQQLSAEQFAGTKPIYLKGEEGSNLSETPMYQKGGPVRETGPGILHKGEYVLDKDSSEGILGYLKQIAENTDIGIMSKKAKQKGLTTGGPGGTSGGRGGGPTGGGVSLISRMWEGAKTAGGAAISFAKEAAGGIGAGISKGYEFAKGALTGGLKSRWDQLKGIFTEASMATGIPVDMLARIGAVESGLRPDAKAGTSSAGGIFQFIDSTWNSMLGKFGPKYGFGFGTNKFDPRANILLGAEYIKSNYDYLKGVLSRDPSAGDLYMAHFLGPGMAAKFLSAMYQNPSLPAVGVIGQKAADANKNIFYSGGSPRSLAEVYNLMTSKVASVGSFSNESLNQAVASGITPIKTEGLFSAAVTPKEIGTGALTSPAEIARGQVNYDLARTNYGASVGAQQSANMLGPSIESQGNKVATAVTTMVNSPVTTVNQGRSQGLGHDDLTNIMDILTGHLT